MLGFFVLFPLAAALASPASAGAAQLRGAVITPTVQPSGVIGLSPQEADQITRASCELGSTVSRIPINWARLEATPGQFDPVYAAGVDRMIARLSQCGIKTVLTVFGTPCWAATAPGGACTATSWRYPPRTSSSFGALVTWALQRWGPSLAALEVWNEQNLPDYWLGSVGQYVALVNEAVDRAQAIGSPVPIITGGLAGADYDYLAQMYAAGMRGQAGIGIHPYTLRLGTDSPGFVNPSRRSRLRASIARIHRTMLAYGDLGRIWLTEFGYSVCPAVPYCVSPARQSKWIVDSLDVAARLRYVRAALIYSLRDTANSTNWDSRFGLLNLNFTPRPSWFAVRRAFNDLSG